MVYRLFGIFLLVLGACGDAETVTVDEQPNDPFDVSNESDAGLHDRSDALRLL